MLLALLFRKQLDNCLILFSSSTDLTQLTRELAQPEKNVTAIEMVPNSATLAFALADGNVRVFDYLK